MWAWIKSWFVRKPQPQFTELDADEDQEMMKAPLLLLPRDRVMNLPSTLPVEYIEAAEEWMEPSPKSEYKRSDIEYGD